MTRRLAARVAGTIVLAAGTVAAFTMPASATDAPAPLAKAATQMEAMQRDLGLTAEQAQQRLHDEAIANEADQALRGTLADAFGGSRYDAELGKLVVGVTDADLVDEVRAAGAEAKVVQFSAAQLGGVVDGLNAQQAPQGVTGWYVDSGSNKVVLTAATGSAARATDFVRSTGVDAQAVQVVKVWVLTA